MKNVLKKVSMVSLVGATLALAATATVALAAGPRGGFGCGPRYCLDVWRPVICPNGQVYSNDCYAARACQTGCVPWGGDTQ